MDATGGFIQTVIDRTRAYLDDPSLDAKYDDNFLVKHVISPMFASIASRINNSTSNPISVWIPFPLTQGTEYYSLPPCVGEVWRMAIRNDDNYVSREAMPRTEWHYRGPNWKVEGNMIVFSPKPDMDYADIELQFMHSGEVMPFRSSATLVGAPTVTGITGIAGQFSCTTTTALIVGQAITITGTYGGTGSISNYSSGNTYYIIATNGTTTFTLSATEGGTAITTTIGTPSGLTYTVSPDTLVFGLTSTPEVGVIDRRDNAYLGSMVRILTSTGIVEERIISKWTKSSTFFQTKVRLPFTYATAGSLTVEYAPFGLESLYEAVAVGGAIKLGTYKKITGSQFQMLQMQYKDAMKTCMDHFSSQQMRTGKYFERNTADNKLNDWRNI
jgi:hypothetical protein